MIIDKDRNSLIIYRIEQAYSTLEEANHLMNSQMYRGAVNRLYYAAFYMLSALGILYQFETGKHQQLIGWFNKKFIFELILPKECSRIIFTLYNKRTKGDYDLMVNFNDEEVMILQTDVLYFLETLKAFILKEIETK